MAKDLNSKVDIQAYDVKMADIENKINNKASKDVASTSANGLMSSSDKTKLNGIATNANNYVHPTTSGNKHIPSGGSSGQVLKWSSDGTAVWANDNNTTYSVATTSTNGLMSSSDKSKLDGIATNANNYSHPTASGSKHIPSGGSSGQYLKWSADGTATWASIPTSSYDVATTSTNGLMSSSDKTKLNGIATNANNYSHPTTSGNKHIPSGGSSGQFLKWSSDGTAVWANDNNTTYSAGTGLSLSGTTFSANIGTGSGQVAAGNHTHSYLPLSGGTLTSNLTISKSNAASSDYVVKVTKGGVSAEGAFRSNRDFVIEKDNVTGYFTASTDGVNMVNYQKGILNISNSGVLRFSSNNNWYNVYHQNNKPTAHEIGAVKSGGNADGTVENGAPISTSSYVQATDLWLWRDKAVHPEKGYTGLSFNIKKSSNSNIGALLDFQESGILEIYGSDKGWVSGQGFTDRHSIIRFHTQSTNPNTFINTHFSPWTNHKYSLGGLNQAFSTTYTRHVQADQNMDLQLWSGKTTYGSLVVGIDGYLYPSNNGGFSVGRNDKRIHTLFTVNSVNVSSDKNTKNNIKYIKEDEGAKLYSLNNSNSEIEELTLDDFYNFVKDDLKLASFNYNTFNEARSEDKENFNFGFIAQDIEETRIGQKFIIKNEEGNLSYNSGSYTSILAAALQKSINKIESLELEIQALKNSLR